MCYIHTVPFLCNESLLYLRQKTAEMHYLQFSNIQDMLFSLPIGQSSISTMTCDWSAQL